MKQARRTAFRTLRSPHLQRASSLLRTLVVATATLTTLMVVFAIYQSTQKPRAPRQPSVQAAPIAPAALNGAAPDDPPPSGGAVELAPNVRIGRGAGAVLSIYPPTGDQAIAEVEAQDWFPVREGGEEYKLIKPLIRLRARSGQRVNVRSDEGVIEINWIITGSGKRPEWRRGTLTGSVTVQIDRLTDKEREALPATERDLLAPWRLVTLQLESIAFDLEYNHVRIDGPFSLTSQDVDLEGADLEVRLDPAGENVETLSLAHGRKLVVRGSIEAFSLAELQPAGSAAQRTSWLEALRSGLAATGPGQAAPQPAKPAEPAPAADAPKFDEEGALVLQGSSSRNEASAPARTTTYQVQFEQDVRVAHERDGAEIGRLESGLLTILRDFVRGGATAPPQRDAQPGDSPAPASDTLTVTWTGPLKVEAVDPLSQPPDAADRLHVTAVGAPVIIADPTGEARCDRLFFEREARKIRLEGSASSPIILDNAEQGRIEAVSLSTSAEGDRHTAIFTGPGKLVEVHPQGRDPEASPTADASSAEGAAPPGTIEFSDRLELDLARRTFTRYDVASLQTVTEDKVIPVEARFFGDTRMTDADNRVAASTMTVVFDPDARELRVRSLRADTAVNARLGADAARSITCERLEVDFNPAAGRIEPVEARAFGNVVASHGSGTLAAEDRVTFTFAKETRVVSGFDPLDACLEARRAGVDPSTLDWEALRRAGAVRNRTETHVYLQSLTARRGVVAKDDHRGLDLQAESLTCVLDADSQLVTATVDGRAESWARVTIEDLTIEGPSIFVDVIQESARVDAPGHMTFLSLRDLDGRDLSEPAPMTVAWKTSMHFAGERNRAEFSGGVHAESGRHVFDAQELSIDFRDAPLPEGAAAPPRNWWILSDLVERPATRNADRLTDRNRRKQPVFLSATGRVAAVLANYDDSGAKLLSRSRLAGPALTLDLRDGGPRQMSIEGEGTLSLEDYEAAAAVAPPAVGDRFLAVDASNDRSQTLITWRKNLVYDLDQNRATFADAVQLQYLTGRYMVLAEELGLRRDDAAAEDEGRETTLDCDLMIVDFARGAAEESARPDAPAGMDARRIRQFRAKGAVRLNDAQLILTADDLAYHRPSQQLLLEGAAPRGAELFFRRPGSIPQRLTARRLSWDLVNQVGTIIEPLGTGGS